MKTPLKHIKTPSKLAGLVTLVTGAGSGLGKATAQWFVNRGSRVVLLDLPTSEGKKVAKSFGKNCIFAPADVTSETEVKAAIDLAESEFGGLHVAINCAGTGIGQQIYYKKKCRDCVHPLESFSRIMEVNTVGSFNVMRLSIEAMARRQCDETEERGVLINTASVAAFDGQVGQAAYSASKGAIVAMTLPIARDLADLAIRVCTIAPGVFDSPLITNPLSPKGRATLSQLVPFPPRLGFADEYAHMCQAIVENRYMNGEVIRLDGAIRMMP